MRTYLVTGGAGFIGSQLVAALTQRFPNDRVVVADLLRDGDKWKNLAGFPPDEIIAPNELLFWLEANKSNLEMIIHLGAMTNTKEKNADMAVEQNVTFPKVLRNWAIENRKRFMFGSSAGVYGAGEHGFRDDMSLDYIKKLHPLNAYGWSKYAFDYHIARSLARGEPQPQQWIGLRFFNIYGPHEYHKGDQASVLCQIFPHVRANRPVNLFKSEHPDYSNGGQLRDFMYVMDCIHILLWFVIHPEISGMFNIGTGKARSFQDLATAAFNAMGHKPLFHYIDMPPEVRTKYQYFTQADISKLREVGYDAPFMTLEEGVKDYIQRFLNTDHMYL
ncbi:MAG: ADP-glyceromanno-heptose 6-epimerase [Alphaproteobacteria bacterium]|nr:MAG: ADP-glyceromanno-heptose 6-epimerase [Alphaproteobacteria bacterium]TAF14409.1 MAG: ADP-glyceromanno-heptose 6-epimerase [Alphaproteobacteria bacterium]TAF39570.1 MAG: ADP-glyceromanno-heptose 6-epimerase [Alphaproteobacteria bacterium]TAF77553.1 MAG: ADP-glyceromanno-heptose 6-epimerase [Alphaproteobacteria bacterium]